MARVSFSRHGAGRLLRSGWLEGVLALLLGVLVIVLSQANRQPWQVMALDLSACLAAALTARWPRAAGIALGIVMATYLVIPTEWATMGEYAPLIPILGSGMRGNRRIRVVMTACYLPLLGLITGRNAPPGGTAIIVNWIIWVVMIGALWVIGTMFDAYTRAREQAHRADLLMRRQAVARELHDTVARSLTGVAMAAGRARLRGGATASDLDRIATAAENAMRELRLVMTLLKDAPDPEATLSVQRTPLTEALEAGVAELESSGFAVTTTVQGDLATIPAEHAVVLGTVAQEAIANIVKHGDPGQSSEIMVEVTSDATQLAFLNGRSTARDAAPAQQGMGLWGAGERLHEIGGDVTTDSTPNQWITLVRLPVHAMPGLPERMA